MVRTEHSISDHSPTFFSTPNDFDAWIGAHRKTERRKEILFSPILPDYQDGMEIHKFLSVLGQIDYSSRFPLSCQETFLRTGNRARDHIFEDFRHFYQRKTLAKYGVAILGAGILANTKMDLRFQRWHAKNIKCNFTHEFSEFSRTFGEGKIFIPVAVTAAFVYRWHQERHGRIFEERPLGEFFDRTARAYAVGTPILLVGQYAMGGNRPRYGSSYWKPLQENHSISGHAYIGAIPFITAAHMTENVWAKGIFYTLSIIPGWSRVNDDAHYLSQAILGWYLAHLAVQAVSETEGAKPIWKNLTFFPVTENNSVGIGFLYQR